MKTNNTPIEMYLRAMYEFRERTIAIGLMCNNMYKVKKGGSVFDIENICLQMRKLLELIAMSSLIMNKEGFEKAQKNLSDNVECKINLKRCKTHSSSIFSNKHQRDFKTRQ